MAHGAGKTKPAGGGIGVAQGESGQRRRVASGSGIYAPRTGGDDGSAAAANAFPIRHAGRRRGPRGSVESVGIVDWRVWSRMQTRNSTLPTSNYYAPGRSAAVALRLALSGVWHPGAGESVVLGDRADVWRER